MAGFNFSGIQKLIDDLSDLADMPDSVTDAMLNAEADIVADAQRRSAKSMGVYRTGETAASIKKTKIKKTDDGKSISVSPQGTNKKGNRNGEVAFVNEYGKIGQPARPFIRTANEQAEPAAVQAGEKILNDFINSKNL